MVVDCFRNHFFFFSFTYFVVMNPNEPFFPSHLVRTAVRLQIFTHSFAKVEGPILPDHRADPREISPFSI